MSTTASDKEDYPVETPEGTIIAQKSSEEQHEQSFTLLTEEQNSSIEGNPQGVGA